MYLFPARQQARVWGALLPRRPLTAPVSAPGAAAATAAGSTSRLRRARSPTMAAPMALGSSVAAVRWTSTSAFDPAQMTATAPAPDATEPHTDKDAGQVGAAASLTASTSRKPDTAPAAPAATTNGAPNAYAPWEVRAVVLPLLPPAPPGTTGAGTSAATLAATGPAARMTIAGKMPSALEVRLPKMLRAFLASEEKAAAAAATGTSPVPPPAASPAPAAAASGASAVGTKSNEGEAARALRVPMVSYMLRHFPNDVALLPSGHLVRVATAATAAEAASSADPGAPAGPPPPSPASASAAAGLPDTSLPPRPSMSPPPPLPPGSTSTAGAAAAADAAGGTASDGDGAAPPVPHSSSAHPPPPPPVPSSSSATAESDPNASSAADGAKPLPALHLRSVSQMMDLLAPHLPTFFVHIDAVEPSLPSEVRQLYADTTFRYFLKRFRHYVDLRAGHGHVEVRLRADFDHPQRGAADARHTVGGMLAGSGTDGTVLRRPPRNSEANLIGYVAPQVPKAFTPLANFLQELAPIISRHPAFDPRLGVMGLLGKYPEYFQIAQNKVRARPYDVAPNALDSLDETSSPFPQVFAKVLQCVNAAAQGKNFAVAEEKAAAAVSTGRLYALLTSGEKNSIKLRCRSFPTFLRLHGKCIVVSVDKMKVHQFQPPYEACVETLADERLRMNSLRPDDPVLQIPAEMPAESNADWAVRQLYDALPLMQCAELDEVMSLVPPAVRDALPRDVAEVQTVLQRYPEYFTTWRYPDDASVIVIQRARVEAPALEKADVVRMVLPLIPQGGTTLSSLRTRVPLVLQRYFYHHGTVTTLSAMTDVFAISGDRIVRMA